MRTNLVTGSLGLGTQSRLELLEGQFTEKFGSGALTKLYKLGGATDEETKLQMLLPLFRHSQFSGVNFAELSDEEKRKTMKAACAAGLSLPAFASRMWNVEASEEGRRRIAQKISRAEFSALDSKAQAAFCRQGGIVIDPEKPRSAAPAGMMHREDFDQLTVKKKAEFMRGGGKLVR